MRFVVPLTAILMGCTGHETPGSESKTTLDPTDTTVEECESEPGDIVEFLPRLGCLEDFELISAIPVFPEPGTNLSVWTAVDRNQDDLLYFINSKEHSLQWSFAHEHLGASEGMQPITELGQFNLFEYSDPDRRFLLGAVTRYDDDGVWAYELDPTDNADAAMIQAAFDKVCAHAWMCDELYFHPTSELGETMAADLPDHIPVITNL